MKFVIHIGHPYDIAFFKRLCPFLRDRYNCKITAIVGVMNFFKEFDDLETIVLSFADQVITIPEEETPHYSHRFLNNFFKTRKAKQKLSSAFDKEAILLSADKSAFFSNMVASQFSKIVLFQSPDKMNIDHLLKLSYYLTSVMFTNNFLAGARHVLIYVHPQGRGHIREVKVLRPKHHILYLSEDSGPDKVVLPSASINKPSKKIIIFGSRFLEWSYFKPIRNTAEPIILDVYQKMHQTFIDYEVIYKPHPRETGREFNKINEIFEGKLNNVGNKLNSELFLLEHPDIEFCFSLNSTSSRSAYSMGFNSKVFYKMLGFEDSVASMMNNNFSEMPEEFFIEDINPDFKNPSKKNKFSPNLDPLYKIIDSF